MADKKKIMLLLAGFGAGLGVYAWVRQKNSEVPGLSAWQTTILEKYGVVTAERVASRVQGTYPLLLCQHELPANPILRWHAAKNILPGLALYQALLEEHGGDSKAALADVDLVFRSRALARSKVVLAPFKLFQDPYQIFRSEFNHIMKVYPAEGWDFEPVEDSDERIAFNGTRCFYLDTLKAYGAPELCASFCKTDDIMAELFPPQIRFDRTKTLGRGDDICDFQYWHMR